MLAPSLAVLLSVSIYPVFNGLWLSLRNTSLIFQTDAFIGLDNYSAMVADPKFWNAWRNTLVFTVFFHRSGNGSWAFDGPYSFRDLWGTWLGPRFDAYPVGHSDSGHFQDVRLDVRRAERNR